MSDPNKELIESLCKNLQPSPKLENCNLCWLKYTVIFLALGIFLAGVSAQYLWSWEFKSDRVYNPNFLSEQLLLFLVFLTSAGVAIKFATPGKRNRYYLLPILLLLAIWTILSFTTFDSFIINIETAHFFGGYQCFIITFIASLPAALFLSYKISKRAALNKSLVGFFTFLSAASLGTLSLQFFCPDINIMIKFVWHIAPLLLLALFGSWLGKKIWRWDQIKK